MGRPHGGLCWVIHKRFNLLSQTIFNHNIIKAVITSHNKTFNLYGAWLPFDNKTKESLCLFKSNLSLIESQIKLDKDEEIIILGDFNADLKRGNRFDKILVKFVERNFLMDSLDFNSQSVNYTYRKGDYVAKLDHIFIKESAKSSLKYSHICDDIEKSDHYPVVASFKYDHAKPESAQNSEQNLFHKFNWNNKEFTTKFSVNIQELLTNNNDFVLVPDITNARSIIDSNLSNICKILIKGARMSEKELNITYKIKFCLQI